MFAYETPLAQFLAHPFDFAKGLPWDKEPSLVVNQGHEARVNQGHEATLGAGKLDFYQVMAARSITSFVAQ